MNGVVIIKKCLLVLIFLSSSQLSAMNYDANALLRQQLDMQLDKISNDFFELMRQLKVEREGSVEEKRLYLYRLNERKRRQREINSNISKLIRERQDILRIYPENWQCYPVVQHDRGTKRKIGSIQDDNNGPELKKIKIDQKQQLSVKALNTPRAARCPFSYYNAKNIT